jgi:hypothetical protein
VRDLPAELAFLADFIPEHQRCTMQGYYLATTQAAAELIASDELKQAIAQKEEAAAEAAAALAAAKAADAAEAAAANPSSPVASQDPVPVAASS